MHTKFKFLIITFLFVILNTNFLFSQSFHISEINYEIKGMTKQYALEQKVKFNKKDFDSLTELENYLKDYQRQITNLRAFSKIDILYQIDEIGETNNVSVQISLEDSYHLIMVPYFKYDSNIGFNPKLKAKDSNFLGTLNTLSADIFAQIPFESSTSEYIIGATLSFDIPFKASIFDAEWINRYTFSYTFGNDSPEWNLQTGIKLSLPFDIWTIQFELYQYSIKDFDYKIYNDDIYFTEYAKLSFPVTIYNFDYLGDLSYTPGISINYNWDINKINKENYYLSTPVISQVNTISASRVDWDNDYRIGLSFSFTNNFNYNIQLNDFYTYIGFDVSAYYNYKLFDIDFLDRIGICTQLYTFTYLDLKNNKFLYGSQIGQNLRGIRDEQFFGNPKPSSNYTTSSAIILNLDFPYHLFTTNFQKRFINNFNFDLQLSPFVDIALINNKLTNRIFDLKDGFYAAGFEILVYPLKWSSFTIRGSLGFDIGRILLKDYLDTSWRKNCSKYEMSIGVGLHY